MGEGRPYRELAADAEASLRFGSVARAQALYALALAGARSPARRAAALAGLGQCAFATAAHGEAAELLERAVSLSPALLDRDPAAADTLGRVYGLLARYEDAVALLQGRLAAAERAGDTVQALRFALLLANALVDRGSLRRAARVLGLARERARRLGDPLVEVQVLWTEARLLTGRRDDAAAERCSRRALAILERTEHETALRRARHLLAHVLLNRGEATEALALLDAATPAGDDANAFDVALFDVDRARALLRLGRAEEAHAVASASCARLRPTSPTDAGRALVVLGELHERRGEDEAALARYREALSLMSRPEVFRREAVERLARLLESLGRADEAVALLEESLQLRADTPA